MATEPPVTTSGGMINRIKAILLTPKEEFSSISTEPMTTQGIMTGWVLPLAAIGPVASAIGMLAFGFSFLGMVHVTASPTYVIATAVTRFVVAVVSTFLLGLVIDALAPSFGSEKNQVQALKVAAYSSTASWLAGIFGIIPALVILGIVGLYSLYLFFVALPIMMKTPADKAVGYAVVVIVVAAILFVVTGAIVGMVTAGFAPTPSLGSVTLG